MATRIKLQPQIADKLTDLPGRISDAEMVAGPKIAPPPDLLKRLSAAVQKGHSGWTVTITVRAWTRDAVVLNLHGERDPASGAPPAPATDSAAAGKLVGLSEMALESLLAAWQPGTSWRVHGEYSRTGDNSVDVHLRGAKDVPPTCADGAPTEPPMFPMANAKVVLSFSNKKGNFPKGRWFFVHCLTSTFTSPPSAVAQLPNGTSSLPAVAFPWTIASNSAVVNVVVGAVTLAPNQTYAYLAPEGATISMKTSDLSGCIVWWQK
jgi:hypothetical protein